MRLLVLTLVAAGAVLAAAIAEFVMGIARLARDIDVTPVATPDLDDTDWLRKDDYPRACFATVEQVAEWLYAPDGAEPTTFGGHWQFAPTSRN